MPDRIPIPLTPIPIRFGSADYAAIAGWPYAEPFVGRLLAVDVPHRVQFGECDIWLYRDPAGQAVGFGTLEFCRDYETFTGGRPHPYIPLLAVNPTIPSKGYGTSILRHLIDEAGDRASRSLGCHDLLFLDVYTTSTKAVALYRANGFSPVLPDPQPDPYDANRPYWIMARGVRASARSSGANPA